MISAQKPGLGLRNFGKRRNDMRVTINLTEQTCCNCFTHFAIDSELYAKLKREGNAFYCPNGHGQIYTETEIMRLKKENQNLQNRVIWAETEAKQAKRDRIAMKAQLKKTNRRIANGVCPCCHRN